MSAKKQIPTQTSTKLRKGDSVEVIAGREKGKRGKIARVLTKKNAAVVEGLNLAKRHLKPSQANPQGGIVTKELPIHLSNMMIVDPKKDRPTRISMKKVEVKGKTRMVLFRNFRAKCSINKFRKVSLCQESVN